MKKVMSRQKTPLFDGNVISNDGMFAVVHGIFPEGFARSETRKTAARAKSLSTKTIVARHATTEPAFALIPSNLIKEGTNDLGEISL